MKDYIDEQLARAVLEIDRMTGDDPEGDHAACDAILKMFVPSELREARERLIERCDWWAYA